MALIDEDQQILREIVHQRERRLSAAAAVEVAGVVFDAVAVADLPHHFDVVAGALLQALGLQQAAVVLQICEALPKVALDLLQTALQLVPGDGVMGGRKDHYMVHVAQHPAGDDFHLGDALDLVAEELHAHGVFLGRGRNDLHHIAADVEGSALGFEVVAAVLNLHQAAQQRLLLHDFALPEGDGQIFVFLRTSQAVDAADGGDDDHVPAFGQPGGSAVAHAVDLVVDGGVLLDEGVRGGNVGLRLIVIIIRNEVTHGVVREKLPELCRQLGRQSLVVGDDQRRAVHVFDDVGHGEGLARAGDAQKYLMLHALFQAVRQRLDGLRLVARGRVIGVQFEVIHGIPSIPYEIQCSALHAPGAAQALTDIIIP